MTYLLRKMIGNRPVVKIHSESGKLLDCLVDTGAVAPIFTWGEEELVGYYPSAVELRDTKVFEVHN